MLRTLAICAVLAAAAASPASAQPAAAQISFEAHQGHANIRVLGPDGWDAGTIRPGESWETNSSPGRYVFEIDNGLQPFPTFLSLHWSNGTNDQTWHIWLRPHDAKTCTVDITDAGWHWQDPPVCVGSSTPEQILQRIL